SYYRWQNRANPGWDSDLRGLYAGRRQGTIPRPPQTLVQQNKTTQQSKTAQTINIGAPVNQYQSNTIKLHPGTKVQIANFTKAGAQTQVLSQNRRTAERRAQAKGPAESGPVSIKIDLPRTKTSQAGPKPPPQPVVPKFDTTPVPGKGPKK